MQRRYLLSFDSRDIGHIFTDVLVIGAGSAGLRAALAAAEKTQVLVLTKGGLTQSNTYQAQGGIAAVMDKGDSIEAHVSDTLTCAAGLGDEEVIRRVVSEAPAAIAEMIEWGLPVDTEGDKVALGREGAHSANRIVHAHGDATGKFLQDMLTARAKDHENVKIFENCFVVDLLTDDDNGAVVGALTFHNRYGLQMIWAKQTILAAGGAGVLWRETSNPSCSTADAVALAFRAGAELAEMEMMQFHPTTLYIAGATRSLISEAVRGEGAHLIDRNGYRFMNDYHGDGELAPRDVVSRAIAAHTAKTGATHVFLDVRHIGADIFKQRFPQIYQLCLDFDIDISKDLIPVRPAAHYMIGGVKADGDGRTSIPGLWACGEAACTGLHGANRLASNSLLETLVAGKAAGLGAAEQAERENARLTARGITSANPHSDRTELDLADIRNSLRAIMWRNAGIVRTGPRLAETKEIIGFWGQYVMDKEFFDPAGWEVQNMLTASLLVVECAFRRAETRGVHYREDFGETDPAWAKRQILRRTEQQLVVT
ncbi:MAG: L-aspartate oxidase [Planctomycetota bacterium]|nr:L-aspartate oxidase [Planctomycetota bacterium]